MAGTDIPLLVAAGSASIAILVQAYSNFIVKRQNYQLERLKMELRYRGRQEPEAETSILNEFIARQNEALAKIGSPHIYVNVGDVQKATESVAQRDYSDLVREISHSLNTPLSQIETAALLLKSELAASGERVSRPSIDERISQNVEICKAFLAGFRQITEVAEGANQWNPKSLRDTLAAASRIYAEKSSSDVGYEAKIGDSVGGYPNSYVLSLVLPLLENAFEAAIGGSTVVVNQEYLPKGVGISVSNRVTGFRDSAEIYESGFTSKADHQGLGLAVVRRLLTAYDGATLSHELNNDIVKFTVILPGGRSDDPGRP
ncbi:GHKL domain-containing protein [Streptomyces hawaiiensis]|nr:HAMP domain-containing sensor histidine kinase [Streptomyces hawaiiensis]